MRYIVGVDIGGTCTDCVVIDEEGATTLGKAFSTPPDFSQGIIDALDVAARTLGMSGHRLLSETGLFLHSTTVAENAVVNGDLATAGLVTTRGFEHTLFSTRGGYGRWSGLTEDEKRNPIETDKPKALVPIHLVRAVRERTDHRGAVLAEVAPADAEKAVQALLDQGVEALGICLLWSFANPANERAIQEAARRLRPDLFVTVSHEIAPILGEYERTSTVALNACLGPVVAAYLHNLVRRLRDWGFGGVMLVMQGYGGLLPFEQAAVRPVGMLESGPVSGLMGCQRLGDLIGIRNIISADMGGTTFKVGTVRDGLVEYQRESLVLRYHYSLPKMDVVSLGLAGGSLISVDPRAGVPKIGPRSAGSYPGPVCYDHGGEEPTLTDVDALLGYLNSDFFLGGRARLDVPKARRAFEKRIAEPLGMPVDAAAAAMYRLANSMIYDLVHKITVQRGLDPREFALFSTGGTAGMHLPAIGADLGVQQVVIPHSASVHGAFGLVTSDIVHEELLARPMREPFDAAEVDGIFDGLSGRVRRQLEGEGFTGERVQISRAIDIRYRRQVHILTVPIEITVPVPRPGPITAELLQATIDLFESLYKRKYGPESTFREAGIELVTFRVRASGLVGRRQLTVGTVADGDPAAALVRRQPAYVGDSGEVQEVRAYDFDRLRPGDRIEGPAIVWTPATTVVVGESQLAYCDEYKNLLLRRKS